MQVVLGEHTHWMPIGKAKASNGDVYNIWIYHIEHVVTLYQVTRPDERVPNTEAGYFNLASLLKLKGLTR